MDQLEQYDWMPESIRRDLRRFWSDFGRTLDEWERYVNDTVPGGMAAVGTRRGIEPLCRTGEPIVVGRFVPTWNNMARVVLDDGSVVIGSFEQASGVPQMPRQQWLDRAVELFGPDPKEWRFRCPACRGVQSIAQVLRDNRSFVMDDVKGWIYYSCSGRYTKSGCDWTLGGLMRIHRLEVVEPDGSVVPVFEFAEA